MNITKENVDALNAVVKVDIVAEDYQDKVTKVLNDYRKTANIPGFRKGHVPMGMVKKQYGKSVMIDEVNKLLQESLNKFLVEEKLDILGNPLPRVQEDFNWDADKFSFEFELGLAPEFDVNLQPKNKVTQYNIVATDELIEKEVENIQSRYGKMSAKDEVAEQTNVTGTFVNEEKEINKKSTISVKDIKGKTNLKKFVGAKVGDVLELKTKNLFEDEHKLQGALGVSHEEVHDLDIPVTFTIEEITEIEPAELDQELFDKLFADGSVKTVTELKDKIKEDAEKQFQQQADQQLLNAITENLVDNTKFDLPVEFLQKWLQTAGEKELTAEEAVEEYNKSEKGLRYQLIEGKIMKDNDIKLDYAELVDYAKGFIRAQMAQFGNMNPEEKELDDIAGRILQNQDEAQKLQSQLISQKLLAFYKENMSFDTKEVSYEDFIKEVYK
ncbi:MULTISPECIES: trigger factor [Tenacibaculum]|uniref:Trigger factor n=2 Tax=Tenacibaculum TaxID=104267 RepID=A0AAE9SFJ0_9FLAO|nr:MULTISPECIES: trigger factor [Tenacibaculum]GFD75640.1 peptidylprolyl isomerase [Tenacibaculum sp. KUL113]GFD81280.1 peptidylprolyl isomerase [Tenacibaculum sp. KUL118]GFD94818.1 peptidylprolyl isomerase [Alteromonas sp. KUL154]GFE00864.1 peptidylprolyl isomerase [Alteromonas sp. KUL156]AZJ33542.1 trigger factor [Tenacibaculum mesophilum]|eukprot:TRINITY_DN1243_c0_g1_i2.p1 TRINITY_DN1243_c0_g1~~TRINITY_DN1243_c0_g1_i2.p1  ORF type:complete len:441 (-),score=138.46 TRINITY_DN1243_c0_g1_i2:52-1374(-)